MHYKRFLRHALVVVAVAAITVASASASSSSGAPSITVNPVRPYQPGDKVWTSTPPASATASVVPDANGCQRVPAAGYISHDVYAQTTAEYSNYWSWSGSSSNESFSWYIKKTDGTIVAHGSSPGGGGTQALGANNYYWQVQNTGSDPQAWNVCYSG